MDIPESVLAQIGNRVQHALRAYTPNERKAVRAAARSFRVNEAFKKLNMARANTKRADENLRMANLGFQEGVVQSTTVMEAQTAWMQAESQRIDAEIDVKLSQVHLKKAIGTLSFGH